MKTPTQRSTVMKVTTIRLPEKLLKQAKVHAVNSGTTLQDLVAEALSLFLKSRKGEEGQS
jgi:predicted DNA binding CopG/RHH family protein